MVEDNKGISSLDPLGPEYGKINTPSLDVKGMSAFEGSSLSDPRINFPVPKTFTPAVPGLDLVQPQQNIRKNIVGSPQAPAKPTNNEDLLKAHIDYVRNLSAAHQDKNSYAKLYSYDASPDGNAFYKRYLAYGADTFSKIGFSPLRDNEAHFNANTTMWDDWGRMMKHSFWPLFSRGFVSGPQSLGRMLQGDFSGTDLADAEAYEEAAAIGQSSKSGVSAFLNNTFMNFGYTAGIVTEAIAEELALGLVTAATGLTTAPVLFARTGQNLKRVFKGFDFIKQGVKPISETLRRVNNIQDARKFWNASNSSTAQAFGRFVNPLENTFDAIKGIKADNITGLASVSKTAGGLYRDVRTINMALSEARLEAGMVENSVYKELYNEHYKLTGEAPDNTMQKQMREQAKEASFDTWFWNTALIYGSNKITFGNITSPRGGLNRYIKSVTEDFAEVGGKYGSLGKIVYNRTAKAFEFEARNLKNLAKSWYKQPGFKTAKETIGYLKANFSEGFQENFQEIIARTNENYYKDSFNSPYRQAHEYSKGASKYSALSKSDYFKKELGEEFSPQGFETFASGFFMGMFAGPLNKAVPFLSEQVTRFKDPETFKKYKDQKLKSTQGVVETLNAIDIKDFLNSKLFTASAQDLLQIRKEQAGDKKTSIDTEFESLLDAVSDMMKTKTTKHFTDTLQNFINFTDEEIMKEFSITKEEIPALKTRINNSISRINDIEKNFNYYQEKFPNPVNDMNLDDMDANSDEYKDLVSLKFGWDLAVKNAVFFKESFNDSMQRMVDIMNKFTSTTFMKNTSQSEMRLLFEPDVRIKDEITVLTKEIESLEATETKDDTLKESLRKKKRKLEDMKKFSDSYRVFDIFFNRQKYFRSLRSKEEYKDKTDEELMALFDEDLGAIDNEENQLKLIADLKNAFDSYMYNLAEDSNDYTFDENLEQAFNLLLDHYKLGSEAQAMGYFINMLHNPKNFNDLAERNRQWMRNLYENRTDYYDQMVKKEIENIEDNAILNRLADKGIYISIDDLEAWKTSRSIPEEFFDNVNKKVIQEGSPEYDNLVEFFMMAANAKVDNVDVKTTVLNKELKAKLDELDAKMQAEIEALDKEEKTEVIGTIIPNSGSSFFTVSKIAKESQQGETVNAINTKGETVVFTKNEEGVLVDEAGEPASGKMRFVEAERTKLTYIANEEQIKEIEERYDKLKQDLIEEYNSKKEEGAAPVYEDQTIEDIKANDPELYEQLYATFEQSTIEDLGQDVYDSLTDLNKENLFSKFVSSAQAKLIIDEYNQKKKVEEGIDDTETGEIEITIGGKVISTEGASVKTLKGYIKTFTKESANIQKKSIITEKDKLTLLSHQNTINNLQALINKRLGQGMTEAMKKSVEELDKLAKIQKQVKKQDLESITIPEKQRPLDKWPVGEVRYTKFGAKVEKLENQYSIDGTVYDTLEDPSVSRIVNSAIYNKNPKETPNVYIINGKEHTRVSNVIKSAFDPFGYKYIDNVEEIYNNTIGEAPLTETSIKSFIQALRDEDLDGFNEFTYTDLEDSLLAIYDAGQLGLATGFETTTAPVSDKKAKKADIERRRKEELDKADLFHGTATRNEVLQGTYDVNKAFNVAGQTAGSGLYLTKRKEQAENYAQQAIENRKLKNQKEGEKSVMYFNSSNFKILKYGEKISKDLVEKIQSKYNTKEINENTKSEELFKLLYKLETGERFQATAVSDFMIDVMIDLGIDGIEDSAQTVIYNFEKIKNNEINAKYDAELAALEGTAGRNFEEEIKELNNEIRSERFRYKNAIYGSKGNDSAKQRAGYNEEAKKALAKVNALEAKLKALKKEQKDSTTAGVFTPTTPYGTPKGPQLTTATEEQAVENAVKNFVLNTVTESTYEASKTLGTYVDKQTKNILENKAAQRDPQRISEDAFNSLFNPKTGYLTSIAERASKGEFKIYTDIVVWNEFTDADGNVKRVAGEIDMLIVDTEGKVFIVDLKTGKYSKWVNYNTPGTYGYEKRIDNTLQQVSYANLLFNQIGKTAQIGILPLEIKYNDKTSFMETGGRPVTKQLFADDDMTVLQNNKPFTVTLSKEQEIVTKDSEGNQIKTTAQDLMDTLIPRKDLVVPGEKDQRQSGSDEESPATKKSSPVTDKASKYQIDNYNSLLEKIKSAKTDVNLLNNLGTEITMARLQDIITEEMKEDLLAKIETSIDEVFTEQIFESSEIMPTLKDKYVLVSDSFTTETIGRSKKEISFESGTEFTVTKIDDKTKMITLETIFENKKVSIMVNSTDLKSSFMSENDLGVTDTADTEITEEIDETTLSIMDTSAGNIDSFKSSRDLKMQNKEKAKTESSKNVLDELSKLPKCGE